MLGAGDPRGLEFLMSSSSFFFFLDHVQFSQRNLQRLEVFYLSLEHVNNFQINIVLNK